MLNKGIMKHMQTLVPVCITLQVISMWKYKQ